MTEWSHDGHPIQAGACPSDYALTGHRAHYSIYDTREMVVVARYYVDDPNNRSKRFVEYTCRDLHTSELYPGCRQLSQMSGVDDGDDSTLRPTTSFLPGSTGTTGALNKEHSPAKDVDGDQVLVGFISGSRSRPVIIGVFRHSGSKYGATSAHGERRLTQHKGTSVEIQQDGTYVVKHKSGSTLQFYSDGSVDVIAASGQVVHVGDHNAIDSAVLGTTYRTAEDQMLTAIKICLVAINTYALAIKATADPTNAATPALTAALAVCEVAITVFQSAASSYLSTKLKVGK